VKFSYVALNHEHKKLTGVISGKDEEEAREKLHSLQLSIIVLTRTSDDASETEIQTETEEKGVLTFIFEALDIKGKNVKGTIDAESRKTAFYRLLSEYHFQILSLCDTKIPLEEREEKGKQGLEELALEIEEEFGTLESDSLNDFAANTRIEKSEEFLDAKKELVESVEEIVGRAEKVLEKFEDELSGDEYRAIKTKIGSLMRLRLSNNLKYIQDLADELLTLIDSTVRRHVESSSEGTEARSLPDVVKKKENTSGHLMVVSRVKGISNKMGRLLRMMKKRNKLRKRRKREEEKKKKKGFLRLRLFFRLVKKIFRRLKRVIFARSTVVRKQHLGKIFGYLRDIQKIFQSLKKKFLAIEKKLLVIERKIDEEDVEEEEEQIMRRKPVKKYKKIAFYQFLQEAHLFFGWLLAFYIVYFYFSSFALIKWGTTFPFFSFLYRSLSHSFPFLIMGILFVLFFGMTVALRFSYGKILVSFFYFLITVSCIFLFLFNF
jgi:hypothetical protein